ncbi:hypothetical protein MTO96_012268 [Rhipicephalus appendiculatus]
MHSSTAQACPPSIKDARGATVKKTAGPYAEGDTVRLTCEIETFPPTAVTIWSWPAQQTDTPRGSLEFSSAATQHSLPTKTAAIATTFGPGLALSHREANGREATAAMSVGSRSGFSKPRSFECEATGSRPAANITWLLDGIAVDPAFIRSVSADNVTTSMLLLPASAQLGRLLECRAINRNLPESRGMLSRFLKVDTSRK